MEEVIEEVIPEEYRFRHRRCDCGLDLSDKVSSITSLYRNVRPMGTCPGCGKQMILNAQPVAGKVVLDYEPLKELAVTEEIEISEPVVQASSTSTRRSRSSK